MTPFYRKISKFSINFDVLRYFAILIYRKISQRIAKYRNAFRYFFSIFCDKKSASKLRIDKLCEVSQNQKSRIEIRKNYHKIYRNVERKISIIFSNVIDIFFTLSISQIVYRYLSKRWHRCRIAIFIANAQILRYLSQNFDK